MKIFLKFILGLLFVTSSISVLVSSILYFDLLNYNFWTSSFERNEVYQKISFISKDSIGVEAKQIVADLATPENVKDIVDRNLLNFLNYVNGNAKEVLVYLPIEKISGNLLPSKYLGTNDEIPLTELAKKLNFSSHVQNRNFENLNVLGHSNFLVLVISAFISVMSFVSLYFLTNMGSRLTLNGVLLVLMGLITLALGFTMFWIGKMFLSNLTVNNVGEMIGLAIVKPVISEVSSQLKVGGMVITILGAILIFVKKPAFVTKK